MAVILNSNDPYHLVYAGQGAGVLANRDLAMTVLIGPNEGALFAANPEVNILDPLGAIPVTGETDIWGIVDGSELSVGQVGQAEVDFIASATGWAPAPSQIAEVIAPLSAAIAQQIFATGIPIVPAPVVLYNL